MPLWLDLILRNTRNTLSSTICTTRFKKIYVRHFSLLSHSLAFQATYCQMKSLFRLSVGILNSQFILTYLLSSKMIFRNTWSGYRVRLLSNIVRELKSTSLRLDRPSLTNCRWFSIQIVLVVSRCFWCTRMRLSRERRFKGARIKESAEFSDSLYIKSSLFQEKILPTRLLLFIFQRVHFIDPRTEVSRVSSECDLHHL